MAPQLPYLPGGVELHKDDVGSIYHLIKVVCGQNECDFWWWRPAGLGYLLHFGHNLCRGQTRKNICMGPAGQALLCQSRMGDPCDRTWGSSAEGSKTLSGYRIP